MSSSDASRRYPQADRNSELEQLSIAAFSAALPVEKFVFRRESNPDAGVDGHLELKVDRQYVNLRAQVQLKATDSERTNSDGSVSVPIRVNNLRYLRNGPSPLYVLFVVPRNELRFVWARDELRRLEKTNPAWEEQDEVTIRFANILDAAALHEIHEQVRKEAQLQAQVADILSKASNFQSLAINIDRATLRVTDPEAAKRILLTSGTLIVTAGFPERVERLAGLLDPEASRLPGILMVRAYAEHVSGRFRSTATLVAEASMYKDQLSDDDQQFLGFMRDACDYQMGVITLNEFAIRLSQRQQDQTGRFDLSYRINQLRQELLASRDLGVRQKSLVALRAVLSDALESPDNSNAFKLYVRSVGLEAEGQEFTLRFTVTSSEEAIKKHLGRANELPRLAQDYVQTFQKWEQELLSLESEAISAGHVPVVSDVILIRLSVTFYSLLLQRRLGEMLGFAATVRTDHVQILINQLQPVIEAAVKAKRYETELRAKMLMADYLEFVGRQSDAQALAQEVKVKAQALNYVIPLARAEDHLAGKGPLGASLAVLAPRSEVQKIIENAKMSDETLRMFAAQALRLYDLSTDRLPVVEREYFSMRDAAQDRLNWCRHLERRSDDRHMQSQATMYRTDPLRICICNLHGFQSLIPNPEWKTLSGAFKKAYCDACPDRQALAE